MNMNIHAIRVGDKLVHSKVPATVSYYEVTAVGDANILAKRHYVNGQVGEEIRFSVKGIDWERYVEMPAIGSTWAYSGTNGILSRHPTTVIFHTPAKRLVLRRESDGAEWLSDLDFFQENYRKS